MISYAFKKKAVDRKSRAYETARQWMKPWRVAAGSLILLAGAVGGMAYEKNHEVTDLAARTTQLTALNAGLDRLVTMRQESTAATMMEKMIETPGVLRTPINLDLMRSDGARLYDDYTEAAGKVSLDIAFADKVSLYDMQTLHGRLKQVTGALPDYLDYETPDGKSPAVKACLKGVMAAPGFAPSVASAESAKQCVVTKITDTDGISALILLFAGVAGVGGAFMLKRWEKQLPALEVREAERLAAESDEQARRAQQAVHEATILKEPTKVSGPLRLKPRDPAPTA